MAFRIVRDFPYASDKNPHSADKSPDGSDGAEMPVFVQHSDLFTGVNPCLWPNQPFGLQPNITKNGCRIIADKWRIISV